MTTTTYDFQGRTVIVTGGARGIGLEVGRCFQTAGARTYLVDLDEEALSAAASVTGGSTIVADVSSTEAVTALVSRVVDETGRVDVLVNNAGVLRDRVIWKLEDDDWDTVLGTHLGGTFRCTRACVPHFRGRQASAASST